MNPRDKVTIVAGYLAFLSFSGKLLTIFLETFFEESIKQNPLFSLITSKNFNDNFPVIFNLISLFSFFVIVVYYYNKNLITIDKFNINFTRGNIHPFSNLSKNINFDRINIVVIEYINYTIFFIGFLILYYGINLSFDQLILPNLENISNESYNKAQLMIAFNESIKDSSNLISSIPLFMCFRLLFFKTFKNDDASDRSLIIFERSVFFSVLFLCLVLCFVEFCYIYSIDCLYQYKEYTRTSAKGLNCHELLTDILIHNNKIIGYKFFIGIIGGLSMGLLMGRVLAMDYVFDFDLRGQKYLNFFLNYSVKFLPLYVIVQPFYGFFTFRTDVIEFGGIISFTYFISGFGKVIYLIFILYLISTKDFHKFIYLTLAAKDKENYKILIQKKEL